MTDTFLFECSPGTAGDIVQNVRTAGFGDGYTQAAKNGINARSSRWTVVLSNLSEDASDAVTAFLDAHAGQSFYWTPPRSNRQGYFMCTTYTLTPVEFGMQSISADFEEVFFP